MRAHLSAPSSQHHQTSQTSHRTQRTDGPLELYPSVSTGCIIPSPPDFKSIRHLYGSWTANGKQARLLELLATPDMLSLSLLFLKSLPLLSVHVLSPDNAEKSHQLSEPMTACLPCHVSLGVTKGIPIIRILMVLSLNRKCNDTAPDHIPGVLFQLRTHEKEPPRQDTGFLTDFCSHISARADSVTLSNAHASCSAPVHLCVSHSTVTYTGWTALPLLALHTLQTKLNNLRLGESFLNLSRGPC